MRDAQPELIRLGGGDPFAQVLAKAEAHQRDHRCGLFPAGAAVMQLAAMFVRAAAAGTVLDLGCGIGYSTLWLASPAGDGARVIGIDDDPDHIAIARRAARRSRVGGRIEFVCGTVIDVLSDMRGPVDAIHDDAWFATPPDHLEAMIALLRPGGLLTMPNWFLLVDAIAYAELLA
ncbi:MAG TPA: methyltransferase domain-containing protein [Mycobacterium sp.]|nr:methyltransferase domain-containing protein [Mycobacterium sp.]